jgi:hypothetical protein
MNDESSFFLHLPIDDCRLRYTKIFLKETWLIPREWRQSVL